MEEQLKIGNHKGILTCDEERGYWALLVTNRHFSSRWKYSYEPKTHTPQEIEEAKAAARSRVIKEAESIFKC